MPSGQLFGSAIELPNGGHVDLPDGIVSVGEALFMSLAIAVGAKTDTSSLLERFRKLSPEEKSDFDKALAGSSDETKKSVSSAIGKISLSLADTYAGYLKAIGGKDTLKNRADYHNLTNG